MEGGNTMEVDVKTGGYVLNVDIGGFLTRHEECTALIAGQRWTEVETMATANLTVPIILNWKDVEGYLAQHDIVEVVRCKDCINFTKGKDEWGSCFENPMKMWRETDFCSWGERRADE